MNTIVKLPMISCKFAVGFIISLGFFVGTTAFADMLWLNENQDPIFGLLIESKEPSVTLLERYDSNGKRLKRQEFATRDVKLTVVTVDKQRLSELSIADLSKWRDYAEELIAQQADPVAAQLSRRLLMICIYHGSKSSNNDNIVRSACLNLLKSSKSKEEYLRFRQIAKLYSDIEPPLARNENVVTESNTTNHDLTLRLIQSVRRGQFNRALTLYQSINFQFNNSISKSLENEIATSIQEKKVTDILLQKLLEAEYGLRFGGSLGSVNTQNFPFDLENSGKLNLVTIQEVAAFDLEATQFHDGNWLRAQQDGNKKR